MFLNETQLKQVEHLLTHSSCSAGKTLKDGDIICDCVNCVIKTIIHEEECTPKDAAIIAADLLYEHKQLVKAIRRM